MDMAVRAARPLSKVLLKITLMLTLALGMLAALTQLAIDLQQEKHAVEASAEAFLESTVPSAETAVYNFYDAAAKQVATGLFTQRAIRKVQIFNGDELMIERERVLEATLPSFAPMSSADEAELVRELFNPETDTPEVIGRIVVVVDRSIVPPAIVNRMVSYFLLSTIKNLLFGVALVALVYAALARHIIQIAEATARWRPGAGVITTPKPPGFLQGTEIEMLGSQIAAMSGNAESAINTLEHSSREVRKSNTELNQRSTLLSEAVKARTEELNAANRALKRQADYDALTGLYNRGAFDRRSERFVLDASATGASVAIIMIDVDQFKPFNDHYGHQAGDDCLRRVARALGSLSDGEDILIARYGGEEFVCMIRNGGREEGEELAMAAHRAIASLAIQHERSSVSDIVTASMGLAWEKCAPSTSLEALLGAADEALYEAKHKGRNRTVLSSDEIQNRVKKRREAVTDLMQAVEERRFEPFFQSQVNARTGRIVGMEALARWRKPSGEILGPRDFMPIAEENDMVRLIDGIIYDKCADFLRDAAARGIDVPGLSINLPEEHLRDDGLIGRLRALRDGIDTPVAVELLETSTLDKPSREMSWTIDAIRELGLDIEIDDFGTGRTSIVSLMSLRPSRLKVARELVMPAPEQDRNEKLLACVLEIGNTLGVGLVAEGVETVEQQQLLLDLGCNIHQGFLYARPVPAAEQMALLAARPSGKMAS